MLNTDGTKTCPLCTQTKSPSEFYAVGRRSGDGYSGYCKSCTSQKAKDWQKSNPERMSEIWRRARQRQSPEQKQAQRKAVDSWEARNPERVRALSRINDLKRRKEDPALYRVKRAIHQNAGRARRKGLNTDFTSGDWQLLLATFQNKCPWCGGSPPFLDLDHIVSMHRGGHDVVGNISPICRPCNSHKSYSTPEDFAAFMKVDLGEIKRKCLVRISAHLPNTGTAA